MTLIVIIIDGKRHCSFNADLQQWKQERFFTVINPSPSNTVRKKQLRIFGNVHSELDMTLALFCYDMEDPTRRRLENDMHIYEVEQHQNKSRH